MIDHRGPSARELSLALVVRGFLLALAVAFAVGGGALLANLMIPEPSRPADVCRCLLEKGECPCLGRTK